MYARASALALLVACWTSKPTVPEQPPQPPRPSSPQPVERRAVVRIDDQPGSKRFQGVWLEFSDGKRWVIDYRARTPWTWFANAEVAVTGACYAPPPEAQSISAQHFRVERMRFATPPARGTVPYTELGPERTLRGRLDQTAAPAGSKLAGSVATTFTADDGTAYEVIGNEQRLPIGDLVRIRAREVTPDLAYAAQTGGPKLWVYEVAEPDTLDDPADAPHIIRCPE
jgi:hypothetical protein